MASGTSAQKPDPSPPEGQRPGLLEAWRARPRLRVHLRTVLITVNLVIFAMLILAFWTARFYESELLRQTEVELLTQSAFVQTVYIEALDQSSADPDAFSHLPLAKFNIPKGWRLGETVNVHRTAVLSLAPPPGEGEPVADQVMKAGQRTQRLIEGALKGQAAQESATRLNGGTIDVVEQRGVVVASSQWPAGVSLAHRDEVKAALAGNGVRVLRRCDLLPAEGREDDCIVIATPVVRDGRVWGAVVLSKAPLGTLYALSLHWRVVVVWLIVMVVAMVIQTWYTSRLIVTPLHALIAQSERLARGDRDALEVIHGPITLEVEKLSVAVVHMARALDERARYIRAFASNVSHEFKTPLSSIRGSVELLHDHAETMEPGDRHRFLSMIDRHAERLQRLVGQLLDLARADTMEPGESSAVFVAAAVLSLVERHREEGVDVSLDVDLEEGVQVLMDPVTLETLLGNLIDNARQHVGPGVCVRVSASRVDDDRIVIVVEDDGPGISEANRAQIFKPFFTTARDHGGTGVGLALVASMVRAHGGSIVLEPGQPTRFRVELTVA